MVALPAPTGTLQQPLFPPETAWRPPDMVDLPSWAGARRVAFDCETKDPDLKELGPSCRRGGGYVVGYSFAIEDGPKHYLPIRHEGGDNLPEDAVLRYMRDQARAFTGQLVGGNMQYDIDWSLTDGIRWNPEYFRDIQIADPLIDEHQLSYSVEAICTRHGVLGKDEATLRRAALDFGLGAKNFKKNLWRMPARYVADYAIQDAAALLPVLRRQERIIEEQDLWQVFNLESRVLPILVRMRQRGVRFSWERLRGIETWSLEQESEALAEVRQLTGVEIRVGDVWKPEPLAHALEQIGVQVPRTSDNRDSITKELLASIKNPVAEAIARARKVNKLRTTFAASIRAHAVGDRIHCTFNQLRKTDEFDGGQGGAAYGRLSSEQPNMQQQPARDELAKPWRKIYLPDDGGEWCSADYSQQEPRWLVHFAEALGIERAEEAGDRYRRDPNTDNHDMMTRLIYKEAVDTWDGPTYKRRRGFCKEIFLGKCYGMGGAKLCRKLGLATAWAISWIGDERKNHYGEQLRFEDHASALRHLQANGLIGKGRVFECAGKEGQVILDDFDREAPFVRGTAKAAQSRAEQRGYITTWSGRRCRFPVAGDGGWEWTHKALNRLIQGCSADQTKMAMIALEEAGVAIQLQVHDEIDWTIRSRAEAEEGARIMREVIPLRVPMKVDLEIGPSWGEAA